MNVRSAKLAQGVTLATESPLRDLAAIIRSRTPLIAVESNEEPQIVRMVRQIAQALQLRAFRWTVTEGLQAFDPSDQPPQAVLKSQEMLSYIKSSGSYCLFVLLDFHPYLQDTVHVRFLKDIALTYPKSYSTVVLVGAVLQVPEELRPFTGYFRLPLPTPDELRGIVYDVAADWGAEHGHREVQTTNKALDLLVRNLAGLTATDARRLAVKAINDNGVISESELPEVMRAKYELLGRDSPLSFEYETAQFAEIGGMGRLRQWIEVRRSFFRDGPTEHLDRHAAFSCSACRAAAKASPPRPPPAFSACRCSGSTSACFTASTTAKPRRISARPSKPPKSWLRASFGWMRSKKGWASKMMTMGFHAAFSARC